MEDFDTLVIEASHILNAVENYQHSLGKISNEIVTNFGYKALEDFSKQVEATGGVRRSPASLRMYAYVYKLSEKLGLPKDILFSTCQAIVFSDNPQKYAKMAEAGASRIDILKSINEDKKD